ncbi:putative phosphoglycerate mutase [Patescibacteria group bacterium]|nr:putative phosphoglycerate mutase [Patescibacteria group bacterium]
MSRELWLLRHAKAKRDEEINDFDRPLKKRGKRAAWDLGVWLNQQGLIPDWVLSSPAKRAMSTTTRVLEALDTMDLTVMRDKRLYENMEQLLIALAECPANAEKVLLVGHNPALEDLLIHLVGLSNLENHDKLLPTAALARLSMPDDWTRLSKRCAELIVIITPKSLASENHSDLA